MQISEIDAEDHLDPDEALTLLEEMGNAFCAYCSGPVSLVNQPNDPDSGILGACSHMLCAPCFDSATNGQDNPATYFCPICKLPVPCRTAEFNRPLRHYAANPPDGLSSKLQCLVNDLAKTNYREKR